MDQQHQQPQQHPCSSNNNHNNNKNNHPLLPFYLDLLYSTITTTPIDNNNNGNNITLFILRFSSRATIATHFNNDKHNSNITRNLESDLFIPYLLFCLVILLQLQAAAVSISSPVRPPFLLLVPTSSSSHYPLDATAAAVLGLLLLLSLNPNRLPALKTQVLSFFNPVLLSIPSSPLSPLYFVRFKSARESRCPVCVLFPPSCSIQLYVSFSFLISLPCSPSQLFLLVKYGSLFSLEITQS